MYLQIIMVTFRPGERVPYLDGGMDRSDLQIMKAFKKRRNKTYTSQYQTSSFQPYHIGRAGFL